MNQFHAMGTRPVWNSTARNISAYELADFWFWFSGYRVSKRRVRRFKGKLKAQHRAHKTG